MKQTAVVKVLGKDKNYRGFYKAPPTVGNSFYLLAEDMYDDSNYLTTVEVASVQEIVGGGYLFQTADGQMFEVQVLAGSKPYSSKAGRA